MELTDAELKDLYDRYAPVLYIRCRSILRNDEDANDAVQETFARVIRNHATFRQQSSPLTWMYKISTNYCLNQIRNRKGRRKKLDDHRTEIGGTGKTDQPEGTEDHARIMALLEDCDEQTRRCVMHTYFDDCTREETAQLVGVSVPTVRKRVNTFLSRARRAFAAAVLIAFSLFPTLLGTQP